MRNRTLLFLFLLASSMQHALGAVVRVADGDCAALSAAAASAPGTEPSLIVLANKGQYGACQLTVSGAITVDGAGSTIALSSITAILPSPPTQIYVQQGGSLTLRNVNLGAQPAAAGRAANAVVAAPPEQPSISAFVESPRISNLGDLVLDSVSLSGFVLGSNSGFISTAMVKNEGNLVLRNVSFVNNVLNGLSMLVSSGTVAISHSTFVNNASGTGGLLNAIPNGTISIANSLFSNNDGGACATGGGIASLGGNVISDGSCGFNQPGDRVVADAGLGTFGDNGGLVDTVLLNGSSVAVRNGVAANCEAADARGTVRNVAARGGCDSGAYEFGGGRGLLSQGGMSGFFYDASADGHYVTVQRLDWGSTLVIWNTFDKNGQAAWIYAIGDASGNHIHAQGAQNLGGVLQPGGAPTGSHGFVWGDIDIDLQNCFGGTFHYDSPLPNFGSGQFPLNRLAFLGDLDCSN
jgi:hypothetical protein